jgi:allophanate hydrolase
MSGAKSLEIGALLPAFARGTLKPVDLLGEIYGRIEALGAAPAFIELVSYESSRGLLEDAEHRRAEGASLPLFGIPFAVKDNIDLANVGTTAGCAAFRYVPSESALAVQRLVEAGAIPIGKTNLDQFATGLVGTRTPYGVCSSVFDPAHVSGGSSSGSAVAVARGLVSFALGTDTAGSGRVPAAFNNVVGLKPTRGIVSTRGVVPACRSLDCVSIFAGSVADATTVLDVMAAYDPADPFSRERPGPRAAPVRTVGVPAQLEFFGNSAYERLFAEAVERLGALGVTVKRIGIDPFLAAARLLYGGPWVAERYAAVGAFIEEQPDAVHPVVREIVLGGKSPTAADAFKGSYELAELRRRAAHVFRDVDLLLLPTAPTHPTIEAALASPIEENTRLGRYTNFMNLLDLSGVAVPAGFTPEGLPFGVTLVGTAFSEARLTAFADRVHRTLEQTVGATAVPLLPPVAVPTASPSALVTDEVLLAVAGAHLRGQPLNGELTSRGASFTVTTRTAGCYRLVALAGTVPAKPGLVRTPGYEGPGIEVEVWVLSQEAFGSFVAGVPSPMVIGTVELEDGKRVKGFLCEPFALDGSTDITHLGGWRPYMGGRLSLPPGL